jgi:hypothetical protein
MYIPNQTTFTAAEQIFLTDLATADASVTGLTAGTLVETDHGWRAIDTLAPNDSVYTYDRGMRKLQRVERDVVRLDADNQMVRIPGGVLSNSDDLLVLPEQKLLIEAGAAMRIFSKPSVLVRAADMCGYCGIHRVHLMKQVQLFRPVFADEEIIWANSGILFHCASGKTQSFFDTANGAQAHRLLNNVFDTDNCDLESREVA